MFEVNWLTGWITGSSLFDKSLLQNGNHNEFMELLKVNFITSPTDRLSPDVLLNEILVAHVGIPSIDVPFPSPYNEFPYLNIHKGDTLESFLERRWNT